MILKFLHCDSSVEQEVNGETVRFYEMTVPTALKLKNTGRSIGRAIALFYNMRKDTTGTRVRDINDSEGGTISEFETQPVSAEIYKERAEQTDKALDQLMDAITFPPNKEALCRAIAESMRDVQTEHNLTPADLAKQIEEAGVSAMLPMLKGLLAANVSRFGDAGKQISQALTKGLKDLTGTMTEDGLTSKTDGSTASAQEPPKAS